MDVQSKKFNVYVDGEHGIELFSECHKYRYIHLYTYIFQCEWNKYSSDKCTCLIWLTHNEHLIDTRTPHQMSMYTFDLNLNCDIYTHIECDRGQMKKELQTLTLSLSLVLTNALKFVRIGTCTSVQFTHPVTHFAWCLSSHHSPLVSLQMKKKRSSNSSEFVSTN